MRKLIFTSLILLLAFPMASPAAAAGPGSSTGTAMTDPGVLPLTPEQRAALPGKLAVLASIMAATANAGTLSAQSGDDPPSSASLSTYARHQHRWYYCGPATVQVVANEAWSYYNANTSGESTSTNKYTQSYISTQWTHTDSGKQTSLSNLISGMNGATTTRRPTGFAYAQDHAPTWTEFHNETISDVWLYSMAPAAHVNPRKTNSIYYLKSWAGVGPGDYGHYIPLRGYTGFTQGTALIRYNDSSGGQDEVTHEIILGATGAFDDLSYTVYMTMMNRYGDFVW